MSAKFEITSGSKLYGQKTVWSDLTFSALAGEISVVAGRSGSGKSTLINCLGLIEALDGGDIVWNGNSLSHYSNFRRFRFRRRKISYLFQNFALVPEWSVSANLNLALYRSFGFSRSGDKKLIADALGRVGMEGRELDVVYTLSGGEQQRVAVARTLLQDKPIVLADEPTASLDSYNSAFVLSSLQRLADAGAVVVIVSHSAEVIRIASRVFEI